MTLKDRSLVQEKPAPVISVVDQLLPTLEKFSESELQELRHQIDVRLHLDLEQLNLAEELGLQFRQVKALLYEIQGDKQVPTNQKAQIVNSARAMLSDIVRQQEIVWNAERFKTYEVAFVKVAGMLSAEQREVFFDLYGRYLKDEHAAGST